jgi:hypothetical protein
LDEQLIAITGFFETGRKDASKDKYPLEATLVWICAQFSTCRKSKLKRKNKMPGYGASEEERGENRFWAVATPL